jgi:Right handed beta helix region
MVRLVWAMAVGCVVVASSADAAQRTFVSIGGNDASTTCSLVAPCRSFSKAITVTDDNGEVIVLDSGGYGHVTIDRSVSLIAPPGIYAGISVFPGDNGIDIDGAGIKVALRGLTINGQGGDIGVYLSNGTELRIDGCTIAGVASVGVETVGGRLFIHDSIIRNNEDTGVYLIATEAHIDRTRIEANGSSGLIAYGISRIHVRDSLIADNVYSGVGINTSPLTRVDIESTTISTNGSGGVTSFSTGAATKAEVTIARSTVARNGLVGVNAVLDVHISVADSTVTGNFGHGIVAAPGGTVVASNNVVTKNANYGFSNSGGTFTSRGNNTVQDNFGGTTAGTITTVGGF